MAEPFSHTIIIKGRNAENIFDESEKYFTTQDYSLTNQLRPTMLAFKRGSPYRFALKKEYTYLTISFRWGKDKSIIDFTYDHAIFLEEKNKLVKELEDFHNYILAWTSENDMQNEKLKIKEMYKKIMNEKESKKTIEEELEKARKKRKMQHQILGHDYADEYMGFYKTSKTQEKVIKKIKNLVCPSLEELLAEVDMDKSYLVEELDYLLYYNKILIHKDKIIWIEDPRCDITLKKDYLVDKIMHKKDDSLIVEEYIKNKRS